MCAVIQFRVQIRWRSLTLDLQSYSTTMRMDTEPLVARSDASVRRGKFWWWLKQSILVVLIEYICITVCLFVVYFTVCLWCDWWCVKISFSDLCIHHCSNNSVTWNIFSCKCVTVLCKSYYDSVVFDEYGLQTYKYTECKRCSTSVCLHHRWVNVAASECIFCCSVALGLRVSEACYGLLTQWLRHLGWTECIHTMIGYIHVFSPCCWHTRSKDSTCLNDYILMLSWIYLRLMIGNVLFVFASCWH